MAKVIRVRAREGMSVSFPRSTIAGVGGAPFVLLGTDAPVEVERDEFVRRRIAAGDLVEVAAAATPNLQAAPSPNLAAPAAVRTGKE